MQTRFFFFFFIGRQRSVKSRKGKNGARSVGGGRFVLVDGDFFSSFSPPSPLPLADDHANGQLRSPLGTRGGTGCNRINRARTSAVVGGAEEEGRKNRRKKAPKRFVRAIGSFGVYVCVDYNM